MRYVYTYVYFIPLNIKHMTSEIGVFWGKEGFLRHNCKINYSYLMLYGVLQANKLNIIVNRVSFDTYCSSVALFSSLLNF